MDAIPVYLLHNPTPDTLHTGEAVETMEALKKEGKVRHWGVAAGDEDVARIARQALWELLPRQY